MQHPDIVVTGTGRSGTSTIARILHTKLGVCMGHAFRSLADVQETNPEGEYEDMEMSLRCRQLVRRYPFPLQEKASPHFLEEWLKAFSSAHPRRGQTPQQQRRARQCTAKLVGIKSPHLSGLDADGWRYIQPRAIVRTWRPRDLTVASMVRFRGHDEAFWGRFYDEREARMDEVLTEELANEIGAVIVQIDFQEERVEDSVIEKGLRAVVRALK